MLSRMGSPSTSLDLLYTSHQARSCGLFVAASTWALCLRRQPLKATRRSAKVLGHLVITRFDLQRHGRYLVHVDQVRLTP